MVFPVLSVGPQCGYFPVTEKDKHFPTYLLAIWNSSLVKFKHFLSSLFVCRNPMMFYILYAFIGTKPFSHVASLYEVQNVSLKCVLSGKFVVYKIVCVCVCEA